MTGVKSVWTHEDWRVDARRVILGRVEADMNGCWLWPGGRSTSGYGMMFPAGRCSMAHRVSYEAFVAPIPDGLQIDHLCRVRLCVNPWHLEPVTARENTLRGDTVPARNAQKTHCLYGHVYDEENTCHGKGLYQGRSCRTCRRAQYHGRLQGVPWRQLL